ncbi:two-component system OmpR family sensor kinase [Collimonas sp. PA-H2]|uniref:sensor histidine kinase n=1 Tax=Collimonas sp. PA-H2 TaxID=1881062 RepID=UPI000BFA6F52|nr:ATP-binding protein [Collimonas sp. PA-H2]PFH08445.1 two-component system OmpR family sensor kinase [Collimonas sp. PA-H2]
MRTTTSLPSIRKSLLRWLAVGLGGGILLAGLALYFQARGEANELFDYQMRQIVASLPRQAFPPIIDGSVNGPRLDDQIMIQIWDNTGVVIYHSHAQDFLPLQAELGFTNVRLNSGLWRVYSAQIGNTVVQIAQPQSARNQIAAQMAVKTVTPLLLLFPLLGILIWIAVSRGLAPIKRAAAEVQARDMHALSAIPDATLPQEIQPLTQALNDLLARLGQSINAQRAFVADAAHELRTPLTALRLQVQLAERASDDSERQAAFGDLKHGLERATHLLQQLLTLARQEPGAFEQTHVEVDLGALMHSVVSDFALAANDRQVDLGISAETPASVNGNGDALRILLNNLIDNALRYSPAGSSIDVSLASGADGVTLAVEDHGPGIPEADLGRVFDRFYRAAGSQSQTVGSGLGLAIVKQIADAHRASVSLRNTGHGLLASVRFPA